MARRHLLLFTTAFVLVACAQPTSMRPTLSKEDIAREQEYQKQSTGGSAADNPYKNASYTRAQVDAMVPRLEKIVARVSPHATSLCREMLGPEANCNMHVVISPEGKGLNAHADGKQIVIYPAMMEFAQNDTHLAMVLAHEYAHHFMQHVQATQKNVMAGGLLGTLADALASSQGINTGGQFGQLGAQSALLSYSPSFEQEADYIGLYILARSGYPIEEAPEFWRSMSRMNPDGIYNRTTHPTTPERFVLLSRTIEEIHAKQQQGQRLLPNIRPKD